MTLDDQKVAKVADKYYCELCHYKCSRKNNYEKHLATAKHKKMEISKNMIILDDENVAKVAKVANEEFVCICGKSYKYKQGLFKHQQKCNNKQPKTLETQKSGVSEELVCQLVKDNTEMKKLFGDLVNVVKEKDKQLENVVKENTELTKKIIEMKPSMGNNNNNNNNTNNFNINMFLNEQCKDAINMTDFIKSIQVSFEQLDYTKVNGLEKGITKILMDNMNKLGKYERPLHCTDIKRETLYIKDDDKWEKDISKEKIKKAINKTSNKNFTTLCKWQNENKDFMEYDDKQAYYAKTMSNIGKPVSEVEDKIIKNICKENYVKE
jgi:hypothetical protein